MRYNIVYLLILYIFNLDSCVILCVQQSKLSEVDKLNIGEGNQGGEGIEIPSPIGDPEGTIGNEDKYDQYSVLSKAIQTLEGRIKANAEEIKTINSILEVDYKYYTHSAFPVIGGDDGSDVRLATINSILARIATLPAN